MGSIELCGVLVPGGGSRVLRTSLTDRSVSSTPRRNSINNIRSNDPVVRAVVEIRDFSCPNTVSQIPCSDSSVRAEALNGEHSRNTPYTNKLKDLRFIARQDSSAVVGAVRRTESIYFGIAVICRCDITPYEANADTISVAWNITPTGDPIEQGAGNPPVSKGGNSQSVGHFGEEDNLRYVRSQAESGGVSGFNLLANNISLPTGLSSSLLIAGR
jgi:hypothetical protein